MTGTADAVLAAIAREITTRRAQLDASDDVGSVTVTVRLNAGTTWVRGVVWQEERIAQARRERRA